MKGKEWEDAQCTNSSYIKQIGKMVALISEKAEYKNITRDNEGDFRVTR